MIRVPPTNIDSKDFIESKRSILKKEKEEFKKKLELEYDKQD